MSGLDHYHMSERILTEVAQTDDQYGEAAEYCRQQLTAAQVHATLALAAATVWAGGGSVVSGDPTPDTHGDVA